MNRLRMGEALRRMGKLSTIDVDEILFEQEVSEKRFGDIAVSWGLCRREDICQVWCDQFVAASIDVAEIDPAALSAIPVEMALRLCVAPLKLMAGQLVIAAPGEPDSAAMAELVRQTKRDIRVIQVSPHRVERMLAMIYAAAIAAA
jgi:hypothetical protein